jgi:putative transposase
VDAKRAYRFRCYPNRAQREQLAKTFGASRFVYNWALRLRSDSWYQQKKSIGYHETAALLTGLKQQKETVWLNEVSNVVLQQSLRHMNTAFLNFWNPRMKSRYPTFKKKHGPQSASYMRNGFSWRNGGLTLAKQDAPLKVSFSRKLPATQPSSVAISMDRCGRYFVSFLFDDTIKPLKKAKASVGIDLGVKDFAAFSTGEKIPAPRHFHQSEVKLRRANRRLHRRKKGSANRGKARKQVAKVHARIADQRNDFLHKLSTRIIRENQAIVVESLQISNMVRNRKLAKSIITQGWGTFVRQLEYKANWYGRTLHRIDRFYPSSKRCSACGHVLDALELGQRHWRCPECHTHHDRDVNAARNILAAGLAEMSTVGMHGN